MRGEVGLLWRGRREGGQGEQGWLGGEQGRVMDPLDKPGAPLDKPRAPLGMYDPLLVSCERVLDDPRLVHTQSAMRLWHARSTLLLQTETQLLGA